jgi:hypothetical protein
MDEETQTALARIQVGEEADRFLGETCGRYLAIVAQRESEACKEKLMFVSPTNVSRIIELQIRAQVAEQALKWLAEAVVIGKQAEFQLQEMTAGDD